MLSNLKLCSMTAISSALIVSACGDSSVISNANAAANYNSTKPLTDYKRGAKIMTRTIKNPEKGGYYKVGRPYKIKGIQYTPKEDYNYDKVGVASWYGPGFHKKKTANGETYNKYAMTAAHPTLPMPCIVKVTNLENGKVVSLRVNDRGPFASDRIIDLSYAAAQKLDVVKHGTAKVRVEYDFDASEALFIDKRYPDGTEVYAGNVEEDFSSIAPAAGEPTQVNENIEWYIPEAKKPVFKPIANFELKPVAKPVQLALPKQQNITDVFAFNAPVIAEPIQLVTETAATLEITAKQVPALIAKPIMPAIAEPIVVAEVVPEIVKPEIAVYVPQVVPLSKPSRRVKSIVVAAVEPQEEYIVRKPEFRQVAEVKQVKAKAKSAPIVRVASASNEFGVYNNYIDVGAYLSYKNAKHAMKAVQKKIGAASMLKDEENGVAVYKVKAGPYYDAENASMVLAKITGMGYTYAELKQN